MTDKSYQVTIMVPPPHSLKPERNNTKKILEVIQKMIGLLTGEVPIRCQDVTVYFSMEEWEYLEGHKDLYKDVMMDNQPPLTSPDGSSNRNPPERCSHPLYSQDSTQKDLTIPHHHQCGKCFTQKSALVRHERCHTGEKPYTCLECGKCFSRKSDLTVHQRSHMSDKLYSCTECGKCFTRKSALRSHTGVKPYSCPECWKCFSQKAHLNTHRKTHIKEKSHSCPECGKCFTLKSLLVRHQRSHTEERPYSCPECGKRFSQKAHLNVHQRSHKKEKLIPSPALSQLAWIVPLLHVALNERRGLPTT
ncbi:uncharacterized protein ACMZJ9_020582 [Mantella aurantiaca]